ncbi:MAG: hypothetical protein U9N87_06650 [Planctomycetota bacterium]|nr:hypothetical protein [Planctomycetota bacterium]
MEVSAEHSPTKLKKVQTAPAATAIATPNPIILTEAKNKLSIAAAWA